jgi:hypothetical protein
LFTQKKASDILNNDSLAIRNNLSSNNKTTDKYNLSKCIYIFENDTIIQTVNVNFINENEINFNYTVENKFKKQKSIIQGIAKNRNKTSENGVEIDEDEEGNSYPVNEYIYDNNCRLYFRIDMDTQFRMQIREADCLHSNSLCSFESSGILIKQD